MHEKTGTLYFKPIFFETLLTVFWLTPHLRSFIRILLYQSFHCSEVARDIMCKISSLAAWPVLSLFIRSCADNLNLSQSSPFPPSLDSGTCLTPNVTKASKHIDNPSCKTIS